MGEIEHQLNGHKHLLSHYLKDLSGISPIVREVIEATYHDFNSLVEKNNLSDKQNKLVREIHSLYDKLILRLEYSKELKVTEESSKFTPLNQVDYMFLLNTNGINN